LELIFGDPVVLSELGWGLPVRVIGLFVARRAIPNPFDEVSEDDLLKL
jgi:hypothetical protein